MSKQIILIYFILMYTTSFVQILPAKAESADLSAFKTEVIRINQEPVAIDTQKNRPKQALKAHLAEQYQSDSANNNTWLISFLIPGSGQIAMGDTSKGLLFMGGTALAIGGMVFFNSNGGSVQNMVNGFLASALLGLVVYIWNVFDAYTMSQTSPHSLAPAGSK